jgi:hypothetical protein
MQALATEIATDLRTSLEAVVVAIAGSPPRPQELVLKTGSGRPLADRVLRIIGHEESLAALHVAPPPHTLRSFVHSALLAGAPGDLCEVADESVARYAQLIRDFAGGRVGLDTALSGWIPRARERGEYAAKQSVYRSMAYLLGYQSEATVASCIVKPAAEESRCDVIRVSAHHSLRRMKTGKPLLLGAQDGGFGGVVTLRGVASEPRDFLLESFATDPEPDLIQFKTGNLFQVFLGAEEPGLNIPVTLPLAFVGRGIWPRTATPKVQWVRHAEVFRVPSGVFVSDLIVHRDIYPGCEPRVEVTERGSGRATDSPGPEARLHGLDLRIETELLDLEPASLRAEGLPRHEEMIAHIFELLREDPADYRLHRSRFVYPVPSLSLVHWFDLGPEAD